MFYTVEQTYNATAGNYDISKRTWLNSTLCSELYADRMDNSTILYDSSITKEFQNSTWVCPDVESFQVNNDVWNYKEGPGSALIMVVNSCSAAKIVELQHNLTQYTDSTTNCADLERTIDDFEIRSKMMTQDVMSAETYNEN